jgi:hypothetical protein
VRSCWQSLCWIPKQLCLQLQQWNERIEVVCHQSDKGSQFREFQGRDMILGGGVQMLRLIFSFVSFSMADTCLKCNTLLDHNASVVGTGVGDIAYIKREALLILANAKLDVDRQLHFQKCMENV